MDRPPMLRAATEVDRPLLLALFRGVRRDQFLALGWPPAQLDQFLAQQFSAQERHYAAHYPGAEHSIILHQGNEVGRLYLYRSADEIRLVDIGLLPEQRNRGIGRQLLERIQAQAAAAALPLRLSVALDNPAQRLYRRLGFIPDADDGAYLSMEWRAERVVKPAAS